MTYSSIISIPTHPSTLASQHLLPSLSHHFWSNYITTTSHSQFNPIFTFHHLLYSPSLWYDLKLWYLNSDPLSSATTICFGLSLLTWSLGELTGNLSQVDRLWTFLPVFYCFHFYQLAPKSDPRMMLLLICQVAWSVRLTINAVRRGFFDFSSEDYRWVALRKQIPTWQLKILNFTFIAFIQNILLFITALPQYLLYTTQFHTSKFPTPPLNAFDGLIVGLFITVLGIEAMADNQQQAFQNAKRDPRSHSNSNFSQASLKRGFLSSQLWQYCRHPNFACEQITWYLIYAFTISATFPIELFDHLRSDWSYDWLTIKSTLGHLLSFLINYSIISPVCMTALFYSSTRFTEAISASKYPAYADYQAMTDMFWPPLTFLRRLILRTTWSSRRFSITEAKVFGEDLDPKMI